MSRSLDGLHPKLRDAITRILSAMSTLGFPMLVTDTVRTVVEQQTLYSQGRTAPGLVVTNADGVTKKSNHQPHPDGLGHAADLAFLVNGKPSWDIKLPWKLYGAVAESQGLTWGGGWQSLTDLPHIELKDT